MRIKFTNIVLRGLKSLTIPSKNKTKETYLRFELIGFNLKKKKEHGTMYFSKFIHNNTYFFTIK